MEIIVAGTAGFCFGVAKAVNTVNELVERGEHAICTYGPIIHNEQVVKELEAKGVSVIGSAREAQSPGKVVIRAHGAAPEVYDELSRAGLDIEDATCPYVKKIHKLVEDKYDEGCRIIIIGDRNHPEVKGINGWCHYTAVILDSVEEAEKLELTNEKLCVVAQTTITKEKWENINDSLKKRFEKIIKFDTICNATSLRQKEAEDIARTVDMMLVVGGKNSSNTQKLYDICKKYCDRTYKIETSGDIPPVNIKNIKKIGITAGASTPERVIKEVIKQMSELNKQENEMSFSEAFESSLVTLQSGEVVKGTVIGYNNNEVYVDLGYKSDGIIKMDEFTDDPDFKPEEAIKVGDEIEVYIVRVNDGEGNVQLSKKKVDAMKNWDKVEQSYENKTPITAKVVEIVKGGAIASAGGVRIFVPASQISDRFVKDLSEFLKQTITVRIVEYNKQKRKLVGSARVILEEEKANAAGEVWSSIEIGKKYSGTVKSLTDFGAFVDIGGVDGLIHLSELSWSKIKHPSEVLKIGDKADVTVLEFDRDKKRISLGYRKSEDNPWNIASEKYKVGDVVKGKVVRIVPFGAFVEIDKGVDGLVHISQISNVRIAKPSDVLEIGQEVEAKVTEFNLEARKIGLSIKEVSPIDPVPAKVEEKAGGEPENAEEAIPSEHVEEMGSTIGDVLGNVTVEE